LNSSSIGIVDYGVGNIGSLINMFKRIGVAADRVTDAAGIRAAHRLVLPGIGAFDQAMRALGERDLIAPLTEMAMEKRIPVLGVCLGMQLLSRGSDEGKLSGFGWIDGWVRNLAPAREAGLRVPHMGWNFVEPAKPHPLLAELDEGARFYFVHSYFVDCARPADILLRCDYGSPFTAAVARDNVAGFQFHPEKSHRYGMSLLKAFSKWSPVSDGSVP
jgi:glutamine amidotransferase